MHTAGQEWIKFFLYNNNLVFFDFLEHILWLFLLNVLHIQMIMSTLLTWLWDNTYSKYQYPVSHSMKQYKINISRQKNFAKLNNSIDLNAFKAATSINTKREAMPESKRYENNQKQLQIKINSFKTQTNITRIHTPTNNISAFYFCFCVLAFIIIIMLTLSRPPSYKKKA